MNKRLIKWIMLGGIVLFLFLFISPVKVHAAKSGWHQESGFWYYADSNGKDVTGWKQISGKWYYFNNHMYSDNDYNIDGACYRFTKSGAMITGWYKNENGFWYYYKSNGKRAKGWEIISGKWYYFDNAMYSDGDYYIDGANYRFNKNGAMITGWYKNEYGDWYFYKSNGKRAQGWEKISGKWYYFDYSMYYGGIRIINGKGYEFDKNGAMMHENYTGWLKILDANGNVDAWRYVNKGGSLATGWKQVNGKWYYFNTYNCKMYSSYYSDYYSTSIDNKQYVFNENGELLGVNGGWIDGGWNTYYANKGGGLVTGWKKIDGKWYYFDGNDCRMYKNGTYTINEKPYTFDENGVWIS